MLVAGDFNQSSLGPLADGFTDVVLAASHARGEVAPWTYACGDHSSRIDFIFANEVALAAVVDARVVTDSGLPQHRPLALTLDMERCEQWVWKMRPPKAFPLHEGSTFSKRSADELLFFATGVLLEREGAFRDALAAGDVDGAYAILLEILEAFYIWACDIPPDEQKFYQGRGELRAPRRSKLAAPTAGDDGGAASHARVGLKKQLRRAEELLRLLRREAAGREPVPAGVGERNELWRALLRHGRPLRDVVWERYGAADALLPSLDEIARLVDELRERERVSRTAEEAARREAEDRKLSQDWRSAKRLVYKHIAQESSSAAPVSFLRLPDGSLTAEVQRMLEEIERRWLPIFRKYAAEPQPPPPGAHRQDANFSQEPRAGPFLARYGYLLDAAAARMDLPALDILALRVTLGRMSGDSAAAHDGLTVRELKHLPDVLLQLFVEFYGLVEASGRWPRVLMLALVTLIPKGEESEDPLDLRPISVCSVSYRLWSSSRFRNVAAWMEAWIHPRQSAYRSQESAADALWTFALELEHALLKGADMMAVMLDYRKCFDLLPQEISLAILQRLGCAAGVLGPLACAFRGLECRFKLGSAVGPAFRRTNGGVQGDALVCIVCCCVVFVWMRLIEEEAQPLPPFSGCVKPSAYADDQSITATGAPAHVLAAGLRTALARSDEFVKLTGLEFATKSTCSGTTAMARRLVKRLRVGGSRLKHVLHGRFLGGDFSFVPRSAWVGTMLKRFPAAERRAARVSDLPLGFCARAEALAAAVTSKTVTGCEVMWLGDAHRRKARSAVLRALWQAPFRSLRSPGIVFTLLTKGNLLCPRQNPVWRAFRALRRNLSKSPESWQLVAECHRLYKQGVRVGPGPVAVLWRQVAALGLRWETPEVMEPSPGFERAPLRLREDPRGFYDHWVRDSIREWA